MKLQEVKILVVDDVNAIRVQIQELLLQVGFERVLLAENGAVAQNLIERESVNMVLCDWHMKPVDGMELLKFCRSNPRFKDMGFVMVTAESTKELVVEAIKSGVDDYLVKPLTVESVQTKVINALLKKRILA